MSTGITSTEIPKAPGDDARLRALARTGMAAYGVVHLLLAWLTVQLALGGAPEDASNQGALKTVADTAIGGPLLWLIAAGLLALALWQLEEAVVGHRQRDGPGKLAHRAVSAGKAVLYAAIGVSAIRAATASGGGSGGGRQEENATADLLGLPGGEIVVAALGVTVIAVGAVLVHRGVTQGFRKHLRSPSPTLVRVATLGYVAKGAALGLVGALLVTAALEHDPQESGGLDDALKGLLDQPYGAVLVVAIGAGFAAYGVYCLARAPHARPS